MVTIYRNKKSGRYSVHPMCKHPTGATAEFGEPTEIAATEFEARIVTAVLDGLSKFNKQRFDPERAPKQTAKEYGRFVAEHDGVTVTRLETGQVEVNPWRHDTVEGGFRGRNAKKISLEPTELQTRLLSAIGEAFQRTY
jgi:hypothetical protein